MQGKKKRRNKLRRLHYLNVSETKMANHLLLKQFPV